MAATALQMAVCSATGKDIAMTTAFVKEIDPWKNAICQEVVGACQPQGPLARFVVQTAELPYVPIDIAVMGACSTTPHSVLDTSGKSGRSFVQFLVWLWKIEFSHRPGWILLECVANLAARRQIAAAIEKGTSLVSDSMSINNTYIGP